MRENIYCLQGCDTVCPACLKLRFGPRVVPFSEFDFEVAGRVFPPPHTLVIFYQTTRHHNPQRIFLIFTALVTLNIRLKRDVN